MNKSSLDHAIEVAISEMFNSERPRYSESERMESSSLLRGISRLPSYALDVKPSTYGSPIGMCLTVTFCVTADNISLLKALFGDKYFEITKGV